MRTTLTTLWPSAAASQTNGDQDPRQPHGDGGDPKLKLPLFAGLLAALAIAAAGVAHQHFSRASAPMAATSDLDIETASITGSSPSTFASQLQAGYLDLATAAYENRAYTLAEFYAQRSVAAGATPPAGPAAVLSGVPAPARAARVELINALNLGAASRAPEATAQAQIGVDCWLRESRPDGRLALAAQCAKQARRSLAALAAPGGAPDPSQLAGGRPLAGPPSSRALAAWMERWAPTLERSAATAWSFVEPVAASFRRTADERAVAWARTASAAPVGGAERVYPAYEGAGGAPLPSPRAASLSTRTTPVGEFEVKLHFPFASDRLDPVAEASLKARLSHDEARSASRIVVSGHTDAAGSAAFNLALSARRAEAAAEVIRAALGASGPSVETRALGETRLAVATADGVREARNRRVEIAILR